MTKELSRLEKALHADARAKASQTAKADAITAAMHAFETEKTAGSFQGNEIGARLNEQGGANTTFSYWRRIMNTINTRWAYSLAGSASLAVLAFALVGPNIDELISVPTPSEFSRDASVQADQEVRELKDSASVHKQPSIGQNASGAAPETSVDEVLAFAEPRARQEGLASPVPSSKMKTLVAPGQVLKRSNELIASMPAPVDPVVDHYQDQGRDKFEEITTNPVKVVREEPVSTFSVDVDTASYSFVRASLNSNTLPQKDAVRVEELINYFDYDYEAPSDRSEPFKADVKIMQTPWNSGTKLMSIGIKGYELPKTDQPSSNLVFLIDTSGSMNAPNKLPLLRNSFKLLLSTLNPDDTVSIVTYAGSAGTVLEPTKASDKNTIISALDRLHAGGSTAGAEGIRQAYKLAESSKKENGVNRVILATDGDFNVGIQEPSELKSFVERKRKTGVTLSVLGFGQGNYNDQLMQSLAQNGNGNASYIDTLSEARKVLVEEAGSTLFTIAKDVKLQVEFNPALVSEYRLIGYETRALNREDFNNDKVDAGDIGSGHTVTALYELTPAGSGAQLVDDLRYGDAKQSGGDAASSSEGDEFGFLKIRYKLPDSDKSQLITRPVTKEDEVSSSGEVSTDLKFAASVAAFGQLLRGGQYTGDYSYDEVISLALSARGQDEFGYRSEFINLVRLAKTAAALQPLRQ